jgi:M6 family metalloprotease-like protein
MFNKTLVIILFSIMIIYCTDTSIVFSDNISASKVTNAPRLLKNPVHMLVVFTKFKDEAPGVTEVPDFAKYLFDGFPGSVNHYYDEISFGQIKVTGEYLPKRYELLHPAAYYSGRLNEYVAEILNILDINEKIDFSKYDNDGPDGIPGSKDDDGFVDFLVLMPMSRPVDFITNYATGVASVSMVGTYYTNDLNLEDQFVKIDSESGCIATGQYHSQAVGIICHEFGHYFGAGDLNDTSYKDDETDSAGVGYWDLMSTGLLGWYNSGGPAAPCAYTRMVFGSVGINNSGLVDIYGIHKGLRLSDVALPGGKVYRLWVNQSEYFLIENRRNDGIYYDSKIPCNGLLIWHVNLKMSFNALEKLKLCDLECADGLYNDAGYPIGILPNTFTGGDNLDYWAHNEKYSTAHAGNLGDATDVFDGIKYKEFGPNTNPSSCSAYDGTYTGVRIYNIHPEGMDMVFDVESLPIYDWNKEKFPLIGSGFQRYNMRDLIGKPAPKASALYLLKMGDGSDVVLSVYDDHIEKNVVSASDDFEIQKLIIGHLADVENSNFNLKISRENSSVDILKNVVDNIQNGYMKSLDIPKSVQKITLENDNDNKPSGIELGQNYPNPFNSFTTISYSIPKQTKVVLEIYNILGQNIRTINRGIEQPGYHSVDFNAGDLSSGIYFYRITGGNVSVTKKFLLVR